MDHHCLPVIQKITTLFKIKMNDKKLSKFQFHFPGLLNFPDDKARNKKHFDNWTLVMISFIWNLIHVDRTERSNIIGKNYSFSIVTVIWKRSGKFWDFFYKNKQALTWDQKTKIFNELGISFNLQNNHFVLCYCFHHKSYGQGLYHLYDQECQQNQLTYEFDPRNLYYSILEGWLHAKLLAKGETDHLK